MPVLFHDRQRIADDKYWQVVRRTLDEVFGDRQAGQHVDDLRATIRDRPPDEETLFYHAEPLDVAADLAGAGRPPSRTELDLYDRIRAEEGWV